MKTIIISMWLLSFIFLNLHAENKAQWITAADCQNTTNLWMCFRYNFDVDKVPQSAKTRIAVDTKYWLWINGEMLVFEGGVKRGPNPNDTYYDEVDVAPYLQSGKNTIAFLVWHFGKEGFSHNPSGKAGLFVDCHAANGFELVSNNQWFSCVHQAYQTASPPIPNYRLPESSISYDARFEIKDWQKPSFQPRGWKRSKTLGEEGVAPWNKLHPRIIPQWKNYGIANYIKTELKVGEDKDTLVAYLPYNAHITPYLKLKAPAGEKIIMHTDHFQGGGPYNIKAEYITKEGIQEYESYGWMNGHKVFYIIPKNVELLSAKYRETSYNTEFAGLFECSDPFLNELWEKSRRTLLVTMRDTYMDCPDRERAQWWGDAVNESGEAFYALDTMSHLLMKKGMYELIEWQKDNGVLISPIPSNYELELPGQMLASIGQYGFWNYYLNTGDKQPIADLYDGVTKYLDLWELNENGNLKLRKGGWFWGDWGPNVDKEILFNEWYYLAMKGAKNMANLLGLQEDVNYYSQRMEAFKKAFNQSFWNGKSYRHPKYNGETDDRAQALAVAAGLADPNIYPAILEVLKTQEYASPYMEKYVIESLFIMGYEEYGIERLKNRFGEMVNDSGLTTLYEGWGIGKKGYGGGTTNHAWSGGGLTIMSQYVCGVAPVEPGYKVFHVLPQPAGLEFANAEVPTVAGEIKTSFQNKPDQFILNVHVPKGSSAVVGVPRDNFSEIKAGDKSIWAKGKYISHKSFKKADTNESHIQFEVGEGTYELKAFR
ncbi:alpha-L-rhamnosidase-related protein [Sunxiuqinia sp. A32]|uniref:alpha-L-rhamnosidase-related protein n=1 Tax=Sunxiuqinia sp. A32 TaxID=3461496 RepID=UPI0040462E51